MLYSTLHDHELRALQLYRRYARALRVFTLEDLLHDLPAKNTNRRTNYPDLKERTGLALSLCQRLLVTTAPLAEAFRDQIDDIVIVPNRLERARWEGLKSQRRRGRKPRVGWAGAAQHQGDLELIIPMVKTTAKEAEWIFFGLCPEALRPFIHEYHPMVPFDDYFPKLASLDLDLAIAPLEQNAFNQAKSNLRLLEYGILGWSVVCTDIHPYREAPVTRIPGNKPGAWIKAVRERIHDLDAAEREGERLRQWVLAGWMLEDHLDEWVKALSP